MFRYLDKRYYEPYNQQILSQLSKGNETFLQRMALLKSLDIHRGCVNSVVWDDTGELLLSGSDDQNLIVSKPWVGSCPVKVHTAHRANIFSAKFIPYSSNRQIVSCSGDGMLIFTDLDRIHETYNSKFTCHVGTCYDVLTVASDPYSFFSCGEDGTVRWYDLRVKTSCTVQDCREDILLNMRKAVTAVAVNPLVHFQLAVSTQDSTIHIYDRRMLGTKAHDSYLTESSKAILMKLKPESLEGKNHRITSLRYSSKGDQVLASYSSDYLYLFDIQRYKDVPLESTSGDDFHHDDDDANSGPTLKRLRLRGDWSDTGPQAVPESEMRNQAGDVGQARPTLHSTLMQRMTDILSRMLNSPSNRSPARRRGAEARPSSSEEVRGTAEGESNADGDHLISLDDIASDGASASGVSTSQGNEEQERETCSAPPSIASPATVCPVLESMSDDSPSITPFPRLSEPSITPVPSVDLFVSPEPQSSVLSLGDTPAPSSMSVDVTPEAEFPLQQSVLTVTSLDQQCSDDAPVEEKNQPTFENVHQPDIASEKCTSEVIESSLETSVNILDRTTYNNSSVVVVASNGPSDSNTSNVSESDNLDFSVVTKDATISSSPAISALVCDTRIDDTYAAESNLSFSTTAARDDVPVCQNYNNTDLVSNEGNIDTDTGDSSSDRNPLTTCNDSACDTNTVAVTNEGCDIIAVGDSSQEAEAMTSAQDPSVDSASSSKDSDPSTSLNISSSTVASDRKSPKRSVPSQDDSEDDALMRHRNASARVARAIDKVVQRVRSETSKRLEAELCNKPAPWGLELQHYKGHRNARTMIKEACFWGDDHVMSGSDCGRVFVWDKNTGRLVMLWEADRHVVNCLQPHPTLPVLATSGIDYDIKLWAPICGEPSFDEDSAAEIAKRNEMLLAETRDTVTVPATFMIRMLASLNQLRQDRMRNRNRNQSDDDDDDDSDD